MFGRFNYFLHRWIQRKNSFPSIKTVAIGQSKTCEARVLPQQMSKMAAEIIADFRRRSRKRCKKLQNVKVADFIGQIDRD